MADKRGDPAERAQLEELIPEDVRGPEGIGWQLRHDQLQRRREARRW